MITVHMHSCFFPSHCASGRTILLPHDSDAKGDFFPLALLFLLFYMHMQTPNSIVSGTGYHNIRVCCRHENSKWTTWTICWWRRSTKRANFTNQFGCDCNKRKKLTWIELTIQRCLVYPSKNLHGPAGTTSFIYLVSLY